MLSAQISPSALEPSDLSKWYDLALEELCAERPFGPNGALRTRFHKKDEFWLQFFTSEGELPDQGWKIHVSAALVDLERLLRKIVVPLYQSCTSFKIPRGLSQIMELNSGKAGATQVGKIVTIYPVDQKELSRLANWLSGAWPTTRGPRIPSDVPITSTGSVSVRYGSFRGGRRSVDPEGRTFSTLRGADGTESEDRRSTDGTQPTFVVPHNLRTFKAQSWQLPLVVNVRGTDYLLYSCRHQSAKSRVFDGICLKSEVHVVAKIGLRGAAEDIFGNDARSRLEDEYEVLQRIQEQHLGNIARAIAFENTDESAVLILEEISGSPLSVLRTPERIQGWTQLAKIVCALHESGFVHRDIKLENALFSDRGETCLLDFEFCRRIGTEVLLPAGTIGHRWPDAYNRVDVKEDIYALGASLLNSVCDVSPSVIPLPESRIHNIAHRCCSVQAKSVVSQLLNPVTTPDLGSLIAQASNIPLHDVSIPGDLISRTERNWFLRSISEAVSATFDVRQESPEGFSWEDRVSTGNCAGQSMNGGSAGIIYSTMILSKSYRDRRAELIIAEGLRRLLSSPLHKRACGLLSGNAGIALVIASLSKRDSEPRLIESARLYLQSASEEVCHYDLYFGSAGVLLASSEAFRLTRDESFLAIPRQLLSRTLHAVQRKDAVAVWPAVRDESEQGPQFGAAHGTAGILLGLLAYASQVEDQETIEFSRNAMKDLLKLSASYGFTPGGPTTLKVRRRNNEWCHGSGGVLWAACQMGLEIECISDIADQFLDSPIMAAPLLCHGLAGQLEISRVASRMGYRSDCFLARMRKALRLLRSMSQRYRGYIVWGGEDPSQLVPALFSGWLGPATQIRLALDGNSWGLFSCLEQEPPIAFRKGVLDSCCRHKHPSQLKKRVPHEAEPSSFHLR